jgi:hypothetical protein
MNESTAAAAFTLLSPVSSAILEISSVLFMRPSRSRKQKKSAQALVACARGVQA